MATFLKIENKVNAIPDIALMRMLGASSSTGDSKKIGQFGSGFPYTLALFARTSIGNGKTLLDTLKICLGKDVYTFHTIDHKVKDSNGYEEIKKEIRMRKQNGGTTDLNIATTFGQLDWRDCTLGVRELISNACDGAESFDGTYASVKIETTDNDRSKDGFVRVYIQINDKIEDYVDRIKETFICLRASYDPNKEILINKGGPAKFYRKGVLVGEFGETSLFNYNITDIDLKESRIVDSYAAEKAAQRALKKCRDQSILEMFINQIVLDKSDRRDGDKWERELSGYSICPEWAEDTETWIAAREAAIGDAVVCTSDFVFDMIRAKGQNVIIIKDEFLSLLLAAKCKTASSILNQDEMSGKIVKPASDNMIATLNKVWGKLTDFGMTLGKDMPDIQSFEQHSLSVGSCAGYYKGGCVYVRVDHSDDRGQYLYNIILEECAHYITGANDNTRDFQEFAFKLAARAMIG